MRHASIQTTMNSYGRATMTEAKHKMNGNIIKDGAQAAGRGGAIPTGPVVPENRLLP
jgi:hypothetical protein